MIITSLRRSRLTACPLAVWRAVVELGCPSLVSEVAEHPVAQEAVREHHARLSNVLSHLHRGGYLSFSPGEYRRMGRYWFGPNCTVPKGEPMPANPYVAQIDSRAARRDQPYDRTPATESLMHRRQMAQIERDRAGIPSRRGDYLVYRDGRRVHVDREFNASAWGDL